MIDGFWSDFSRRHAGRLAATPPSSPAVPAGGTAAAERLALAAYCQALFATAEFRHLN
jgi:hypothetical protein